jgi:glucosamine--fructose-6-phosphate aminotransferase (isomerizing)
MWFVDNDLNNIKKLNSLRILSNNVTQLLNDSKITNKIIILRDAIVNNINSLFILGKHKLYSIACEGALKIKEVTYIHCEGFSAGSLKHGPFALLDNTNLTLLLVDYNDIINYANIKSTYYEILGRETNLFVITNSQNVIDELQIDDNKYILLCKLDYYNEVIFTIVLQKLAYEISIAKGLNPDKPRNLAKVVTVE